MILPRYSLRAILVVTALCGVVSLVVSQGFRGKPWAAGMTIALLAAAVTLALGGLSFALIWAVARVFGGRARPGLDGRERNG
jgi:hypothetical protein